jgi:hypothetical protein
MSNGNSIIPISNDQAKAIQEALRALRGLGSFLEKTFGTVPQDLVGLLGGDWLKVRRAENIAKILEMAQERLKIRGVKEPERTSLSVGLPLLVAAADESRDELQDIWARLLAAAADPARSRTFRIAFIEAVRKMDPIDAALLQSIHANSGGRVDGDARNSSVARLGISRDEVDISVSNLERLELMRQVNSQVVVISPFGREFLRSISG